MKNISFSIKIDCEEITFLTLQKEEKWKIISSYSLPFNIVNLDKVPMDKLEKSIEQFEIRKGSEVTLVISDFLLTTFIYKGVFVEETGSIEDSVKEIFFKRENIEISEFLYDYKLFKNKELSFILYAINRKFVEKFENILKKLSINIKGIEAESSATLNLIYEKIINISSKNIIYIHIGKFKSLIFSMYKSDPDFYKIIDVGYGHLKSQGKNINILPESFSSGDNINGLLKNVEKSGSGLTELMETISKNIKGIYIHYQSRDLFDGFYLAGHLNKNDDFKLYLEEYIQIPIIGIENDLEFIEGDIDSKISHISQISSIIMEKNL